MAEIVYLNGLLVPRSQARVSVFDHGFLYGYGLFETMRAYHGKIFRLERHIKRLADAADIIGLGSGLEGIDLFRACRDTLRANGLEDARVRLTVTGGEADAFPWTGAGGKPTVVVTAGSYTPLSADTYDRGYRAVIASLRRGRSPAPGIKSTSYLVSVLARIEAAASGQDEALLLNDRGLIAEGGSSNVFVVRDSGLFTPSLESAILPGITREVVVELAETLNINVTEGDLSLADFERCDEAFFTGSMIEVMPLVAVRGEAGQETNLGPGKPGPITRRLMAAYKEMVEKETSG